MHTNICIDCKNACGGCSWSASAPGGELLFQPVPGWTAERVLLYLGKTPKGPRFCHTYHITACPQFVSDPPRKHGGAHENL